MADDNDSVGPALRLLIRWTAPDDWAIMRVSRLPRKVPCPSFKLPVGAETPDMAGFFLELQDDDGACVYRRLMNDPTVQQVEIMDYDGTPRTYETKIDNRIIMALVPDTSSARIVRVLSSNNETGGCKEVARLAVEYDEDTGQ